MTKDEKDPEDSASGWDMTRQNTCVYMCEAKLLFLAPVSHLIVGWTYNSGERMLEPWGLSSDPITWACYPALMGWKQKNRS